MGVPNYYENYIYNQDVNKLGPNDYVPFHEDFNEGTDYRESSFWYSK